MRCDGKRLKMSPFSQMVPFIMPRKCDSQNAVKVEFDIDPIAEYLASLPPEAPKVSYMSLLFAAYVRALRKYPQVNRFIKGKRHYQRNEIVFCFTMLKTREKDGVHEETVVKLKIDPNATLFEVSELVNRTIEENSALTHENNIDKLLAFVLRAGPLVSLAVGLISVLDSRGLLPRAIVEGSPFHTSLFLANLMSIRTNYVYHHLYELGTTSVFAAMGNCIKKLELDDGKVVEKRYMPLGVTIDERICSGYEFACFFREFESYMRKPKRLETLD